MTCYSYTQTLKEKLCTFVAVHNTLAPGWLDVNLCACLSQEFVKETYFNNERELTNDRPEEIVEQKERIVSVTPANPCACVTGNEYAIGGMSGLPRSRRGSGEAQGYSSLPRSRRGSGQEMF